MRHTHHCKECDTDLVCELECTPDWAASEGVPFTCETCKHAATVNAIIASNQRAEIIRSLVPHVAAGLCANAACGGNIPARFAVTAFENADALYTEGVRRGIYPGKVDG